jgi:hypothetical protein
LGNGVERHRDDVYTWAGMVTDFAATRRTLHLVAAHVLGRRRFAVAGRFGLRASPGGFATPAFGDGPEVIRVAGTSLVREVGNEARAMTIDGSSLRELARFVDVDIDAPFSVGPETPVYGTPETPLHLDTAATTSIANWYELGWNVLDELISSLPGDAEPATIQLWPEHFDAASHVGLASRDRVNVGFSAGDASVPEPYCYVGPWGTDRPGDPGFWNAPFGAVLRATQADMTPDQRAACLAFFRAGLRNAGAQA